MMNYVRKTGILLIAFALLLTPYIFANSEHHDRDSISFQNTALPEEQEHSHSSEIINISLISGALVLTLLISTVVAGRLMKKGKITAKTHHRLAYTTLVSATAHGIYNLLVHYILNSG